MGKEFGHAPVKLILPVLFSDVEKKQSMIEQIRDCYGDFDWENEPFEFKFTHYYDEEMGLPIYRQFFTFKELIDPEMLVEVKKYTNRLELEYADQGLRKVNFDPGYMQEGKFLLATTKDHQHRIYIREGIYEEVTLYYRHKKWQAYPWTYPDYASDLYRDIFSGIRERYVKQLKG